MKVTLLPDVEPRPQADGSGGARSVAVGTFDGVHLGHREVISGSDSVLTFDPHPVSVVAPQHTPKLLTTFEGSPTLLITEAMARWCASHITTQEIVHCGKEGHHAPEDRPAEIAAAISACAEPGARLEASAHRRRTRPRSSAGSTA